jgi:hypothetical protein
MAGWVARFGTATAEHVQVYQRMLVPPVFAPSGRGCATGPFKVLSGRYWTRERVP